MVEKARNGEIEETDKSEMIEERRIYMKVILIIVST